jgi:hypothetical protein
MGSSNQNLTDKIVLTPLAIPSDSTFIKYETLGVKAVIIFGFPSPTHPGFAIFIRYCTLITFGSYLKQHNLNFENLIFFVLRFLFRDCSCRYVKYYSNYNHDLLL